MAKGSKLKKALDRHQGRDYELEKQKKLRKEAEKRKQVKGKKIEEEADDITDDAETSVRGARRDSEPGIEAEVNGASTNGANGENGEWETEKSEEGSVEDDEYEHEEKFDLSRLDDSDSSSDEPVRDASEDGEEEDAAEEGSIPLSDIESLASEDKGDILPHRRLTINNTSALLRAYKSIALPLHKLPFSEHQSITTDEPVHIKDVDDDLTRELAFYSQALSAARQGRDLLKKEGVPFSRPSDFFAEMVKSDEHMGRVKQKLIDAAAGKKAAAEARKQRDLKKFGKQVQIAKQQERERAKKETLEKINILKRKRQNADIPNANEDDLFDVALDDAADSGRHGKKSNTDRRAAGAAGKPNFKRQKKDEKYGFGGKKRFSKSGDALSSADMRGYSAKKMKAGPGSKKGNQRPGKSKRAKLR
ncbi:eukaryotic rRNA processing protein EBP2-domain-containing protein [Lineolata rhizophorae]|uniref:Eukaryotic rRNA processing protein EBP2-domain-containing protein n=1 Tax=Lineolata rhizophorae TaxID=578093 RepID=A0A6A6NNA4_9PEZI|nr:eukaryotic rRNA processing protein EBP2-domain-containing protein [Lineolata rhizophorae]